MNEVAFQAKHQADWYRLKELSTKASASATQLTFAELKEMLRLHRRTSRDLAVMRTWSTRQELVSYLNDLVGNVHCQLYAQMRGSFWAALKEGIFTAARTFRKQFAAVVCAAAIFVGGGLFAFLLMQKVPATREHFVPHAFEPTFQSWKNGELPDRSHDESFAAWGMYAGNNPKVAAITAAVGAGSFGVATVLMDWQNGVILGSLASECQDTGRLGFLITSIIPHGIPEISGLIIASSAGLVLGWALICPGRRTRAESLAEAGKDGIVLMITGVCMMYVAAPIEGYFSFNPGIPGPVKLLVALFEIGFWAYFWSSVGKEPAPHFAKATKVTATA